MYFGQCGELKTNDLMEQKESTTALELVCNVVAYWNAKKISEAVQRLREKGENMKDDDIRFITPLITSHINRFGKFEFDLEKRKKCYNGK
ncbi:Tn3 family transposase [Candidatus Woesearchaeota archaeon]|nr:Tn3 family transposase [Candidatus Woesearchaeota archaeon]